MALLANASGSLSHTLREKKRLEGFEKQVEDLRLRLKVPAISAVAIKDQKVVWARDLVSRISRKEFLRPGDQARANKPAWQKFVGEYSSKLYSDIKIRVAIKNGYLYVSWGGGLGIKLTEYEPGLFFTADGEQ